MEKLKPTNDQKKKMLWDEIDSFSEKQISIILKQPEMIEYLKTHSPEQSTKKGFNIGFGAGFNITLSCLGVCISDINSINIAERKMELETSYD